MMMIRPSTEEIAAELDNIMRQDEAIRAEVENRYIDAKRRKQYSPRIETTARLVASLMEQSISELQLDYQLFSRTVACLNVGCNDQPIECHQASRRSQLKYIRDNGMVWHFDKYQNKYIGHGGPRVIDKRGVAVPQPSKVGARHATVFKGFCGTHDRELFAAIDNEQLLYTKNQLLRLLYRTFAYETYWKKWESSPTKQAIDRMIIDNYNAVLFPADIEGQGGVSRDDRVRNAIHNALLTQVRDRLLHREMGDWMTWIAQRIGDPDSTDVRAVEFRVKGRPFLVCSGLVSARYDFAERGTVETNTTDGTMQRYPVAVMTTWLHSAREWSLLLIEAGLGRRRIGQYVESLEERFDPNGWLERLTTWMMVSCANVAIDPKWWRRIGDHNKMMCGTILQRHHGDGQRDLTNEYWKDPFVGAADVTVYYHHW